MKKIVTLICSLIISAFLFSETITVKGLGGVQKTINVDENISELVLSKTVHEITQIDGIEKLTKLRKLKIQFSDLTNITSDFWKSIDNVEILEIGFGTIEDLSFLELLPNLISFSLNETIKVKKDCNLNLKNNKKIEYIELHGINDMAYPLVISPPKSLKTIDIRGSSFNSENKDAFCLSLSKTNILLMINNKQYEDLSKNKYFSNIKTK